MARNQTFSMSVALMTVAGLPVGLGGAFPWTGIARGARLRALRFVYVVGGKHGRERIKSAARRRLVVPDEISALLDVCSTEFARNSVKVGTPCELVVLARMRLHVVADASASEVLERTWRICVDGVHTVDIEYLAHMGIKEMVKVSVGGILGGFQ
eukprot:374328-Prymnesium_polylepis.2